MKNAILIALLGSVAAPAAFAGGMNEPVTEPMVAPVVVAAPSADWTGGYAGVQLGYGDLSSNGGLDGNGALGGIHAGYLYDFGQFVAGAEVDYDLANIDITGAGDSLDNVARLKLKAGADLGQTLVYATAGAAYATADVGGNKLRDSGYFGGVGMDYALSNQWLVGGEILAHRFENFDNTGIDINATTATIRASYRF